MSGQFEMAVCFGDYLHTGLRKNCERLANQSSVKTEGLYQEAISLKEGVYVKHPNVQGSLWDWQQKNWWSDISTGEDVREI